MGLGGHTLDILRHLHAVGGPMVAFLGAMPVLKRVRRRGGGSIATGQAVKNRDFPVDPPKAETSRPDAEKILSGDPVQTTNILFVSDDKRFLVGLWTCRTGKWRIDFPHNEFIHVIEGVVEVTDAGGEVRTYRAGDAFVTPRGFSGTWDVIEPITKHFVIYG